MSTVNPVDLKSSFGQKLEGLSDFCKENHLQITDTNGDGIFDINDTVEYSVQNGDSIWGISRKFEGCSYKDLKEANADNFSDMNSIKTDDKVIIPLQKKEKTQRPEQQAKTEAPKEQKTFAARDFESIKTKQVNDQKIQKCLVGENISALQKSGFFVVDKNNNGVFDEGEELHKQVTVMLDAGHGSSNDNERRDPGAVPSKEIGPHDEAYFTGVARDELHKMLEEEGFKVVDNIRTNKAHLADRQKNKLRRSPDVFISLHCDSAENKAAHGETVLYNPASTEDKKLANCVNKELKSDKTFRNRDMQQRKNLCVLNGDKDGKIAEILVEMGFVSNKDNYDKLNDADKRRAQLSSIARGVSTYYETEIKHT